jgi:hypothetical protein
METGYQLFAENNYWFLPEVKMILFIDSSKCWRGPQGFG